MLARAEPSPKPVDGALWFAGRVDKPQEHKTWISSLDFKGKIDVLTCGSANDRFLSQIAFARMCFDALGGVYRDARFVACLAEYEKPELPAGWAPYFENIEVVWANPEGLPNPGFNLQHEKRFEVMREDADIAIFCDADVCILRPFEDILNKLVRGQMIAGVMAHYHLPIDGVRGDADADWSRIATAVLGHDIDRPYRYLFGSDPKQPLVTAPEQRPRAPFYLNYGVVMGPPAQLRRMLEMEIALHPAVAGVVGEYWAAQVGLALACIKLDIPRRTLPPRFNYANRPEADVLYPEELGKIVFFHYMFDRNFSRKTLFNQPAAFEAFVNTRQTGADERLRQHIVRITGGRYPFSGAVPV